MGVRMKRDVSERKLWKKVVEKNDERDHFCAKRKRKVQT
jgi:hypothetical protein